jgi:hypothetical protein
MIQQAFGDQILSRTQVFQWHARFKTSSTSVNDDEHTGRPTSYTTTDTHEFKSSSVGIDIGQFTTLLRRWELVIGHVNVFGRKTWACTVSLLQYDNVPSHTSILTQQVLVKNKMGVNPHQPYSPDLAPCDFFLFPKTKLKLKGRRFATTEDIQAESQRFLDFQEAFQKWTRRWELLRG